MIDNEEVKAIERGWMVPKIIWAVMFGSLLIYVLVGLTVVSTVQVGVPDDLVQVLRYALYAIAAVTLLATPYARRLILRAGNSSALRQGGMQSPALARYLTALIVTLALSESIGIYGLVLFFIGKSPADLYFLNGIAAAAMLFYRPNREDVLDLARELNRQRRTTP